MASPKEVLSARAELPKVLIFDLDSTLWNTHDADTTFPPYRRVDLSEVMDSAGRRIRVHKDTQDLMREASERGVRLAIASLNPNRDKCVALLRAFDLWKHISPELVQICFSRGKTTHLTSIRSASKVPYTEMVFFDDLPHNINTARKLGITAVPVTKDLVGAGKLNEALVKYAQSKQSRGIMHGWLSKAAAPSADGSPAGPAPSAAHTASSAKRADPQPPRTNHTAEPDPGVAQRPGREAARQPQDEQQHSATPKKPMPAGSGERGTPPRLAMSPLVEVGGSSEGRQSVGGGAVLGTPGKLAMSPLVEVEVQVGETEEKDEGGSHSRGDTQERRAQPDAAGGSSSTANAEGDAWIGCEPAAKRGRLC